MKMQTIRIWVVIFTVLFGCNLAIQAQGKDEKGSQLTIPWDEFKKLLNLDADQIVLPMETFQKLLAQTGTVTTPVYTVSGGNVILSREEFKKLVDQMKPPVGPENVPPFEYLITKSVYTGRMGRQNTDFTGTFTIHVLKKNAYLRIPIFPQNVALQDIRVDGRPALVVSENGFHHVVLSGTGEFTVSASFSKKTELEKGPHRLDLNIQQTPITLLTLDLPMKDIDVEIPQAQQLVTSYRDNRTQVSAVISPGQYVSVQWRKKLAVTEKIPAKIYSEIHSLISIEDDAFRINSDINYNILHSEIDAVSFSIPEYMNILAVTGDGVGEWQESRQQNRRVILVPFTYGKKGNVMVRVTGEVAVSESGLANVLTGIRTLETVRENGYLGIELNTSGEVTIPESEGMEKVPPQKLPDPLIRKSAKPLIMGFKYLRHPYHLVLDVKTHEKIAVPVATINTANIVTLFTEDGKIVHRLVYQVRNSAKQFLEIQLPEGGDVWSVFVDNRPVEASLNDSRKLLVPLIRSREVNNQLETFPVEVILALSQDRFSWFGTRRSQLPEVDLLASQLIWSVYLPNDYGYNYFTSTLEKEEMIRGVNLFSTAQRKYDRDALRELLPGAGSDVGNLQSDELKRVYKGKDAGSRFKNVPMEEAQIVDQMAAEMEFSGRLEKMAEGNLPAISSGKSTGFLPIMIQIPTSGQVYRFAKTIIKPEDPLVFEVVYSQQWMSSVVKWLIFLFIVLLMFLNRKKFKTPGNWVKAQFTAGMGFYRKHESTIRKWAVSRMTPFVLFGLIMIFWPISAFLTIVFLFLFWVSVVYQVLNFSRKRKEEKNMAFAGQEPEVLIVESEDATQKKSKPRKNN